jgi:hypothetical protein
MGAPPFPPGPPPAALPPREAVMPLPRREFATMELGTAPTVFPGPMPPPMGSGSATRDGVFAGQPPRVARNTSGSRIAAFIIGLALVVGALAAYFVATSESGDNVAGGRAPSEAAAPSATSADAGDEATRSAGSASPESTSTAAAVAMDAGAEPASSARMAELGAKLVAVLHGGDDEPTAGATPAAEATPAATDTKPAAAEATPAATDTKPAAAEATPAATEATPATADAKPAAEDPPSTGQHDAETRRRPTALITLQLDSLPRGAQVIRKSDGVRLGETPFTYQIEPQKGSITVILRHKGYRDEMVVLPGNRSAERRVPLIRGDGPDRAPSLKD